MRRYSGWLLASGLSLLLLLFLLSLTQGAYPIAFKQVMLCLFSTEQCSMADTQIIWQLRLPRAVMALLVGAGLALAGTLLQSATRNPLADPYLFGTASGASLGAILAGFLFPAVAQPYMLPLCAFIGSLGAIVLVLKIAAYAGTERVEHLLLSGVAVSFMLSAFSSLLLFLAEPLAAQRAIFWMMGSLSRAEWSQVWVVAPILVTVLAISLLYCRYLDAMQLGDETALTMGLRVAWVRHLSLLGAALLTAIIVAFCGGVGFVGLMIPHMVRILLGNLSKPLMLGSVFLGSGFMLMIDLLARNLVTGSELPLGVLTSAIGSLFFVLILKHSKGS